MGGEKLFGHGQLFLPPTTSPNHCVAPMGIGSNILLLEKEREHVAFGKPWISVLHLVSSIFLTRWTKKWKARLFTRKKEDWFCYQATTFCNVHLSLQFERWTDIEERSTFILKARSFSRGKVKDWHLKDGPNNFKVFCFLTAKKKTKLDGRTEIWWPFGILLKNGTTSSSSILTCIQTDEKV